MVIFFNCPPSSDHLHPLQVENCYSNSRLVVDEDDIVKSGLKWLNIKISKCLVSIYLNTSYFQPLEVMGRGSGTRLHVGENVKYLTLMRCEG